MQKAPAIGEQLKLQPISTPMKCVLLLTLEHLLVYSALAVCRAYAQWYNMKHRDLAAYRVLASAATMVNNAPMLALLFLICRLRVLYQSQGTQHAPDWMQYCMYVCTYSLLVAVPVVCAIPAAFGENFSYDGKTGERLDPDAKPCCKNRIAAIALTVIKFLALAVIHGAAAAIVYGIATYKPPEGAWPKGKEPGMSFPVQCALILICSFFLVNLVLQCARTHAQISEKRRTKLEEAAEAAALPANYAPMIGVVFMATRLRALQMDPVWGKPQEWSKNYFYSCTGAVIAQTIVAGVVVLVMKGDKEAVKEEPKEEEKPEEAQKKKKKGEAEKKEEEKPKPKPINEIQLEVKNKKIGIGLIVLRWILQVVVYTCLGFILYATLTIEHRDGPENTPQISVTMQCILTFTLQFFLVQIIVSIWQTMKEVTGWEWLSFTQAIDCAVTTIQLAPILGIMFVAVRIRSLQITGGQGAPPGWSQDAMYVSVWAVMLLWMLGLGGTPCLAGVPAAMDDDGKLVGRPAMKIPWMTCVFLKWMMWTLIYCSFGTVFWAILTMNADNANGMGSLPGFSKAKAALKIPSDSGRNQAFLFGEKQFILNSNYS